MAEQKRQGSSMTMERFKRPEKYDVIFHNDDFTTMEFVIKALRQVFFLPEEEAIDLMLKVHETGKAAVGTYIFDIARSKAQATIRMARAEGFPLQVTIEEHKLPF
ncbi:MAG: ATP-dependent Clp protease adaptor ClpS [Muribaculaceae bacterium]|nr:ATP-dependent Clp protease adaptor ClpS [Muribaculaceae bacterium]